MSLVELLVATAIAVIVMVACFALAQGSRALGTQSAVQQFDAAFAYAQSLASTSGNGATIVFEQRTAPDGTALGGFTLVVYSGRPTSSSAITASSLAPLNSTGDVAESVLGSPPFSVFLNSAGHASASSGAVAPGTAIASDPGCPSGESSVTLTFSDSRTSAARSIPCNTAVAGAPVVVGTVPP